MSVHRLYVTFFRKERNETLRRDSEGEAVILSGVVLVMVLEHSD